MKPITLAVTVSAATVIGLTTVWLIDPNQPGHYPSCPFLFVTGLYCPGCGTLRCLHALTHGDLAAAWSANPVTVLFIPLVLWTAVAWFWSTILGRRIPTLNDIPAWGVVAIGVVLFGFGILRNLPGFEVLKPH